MRHFQGPSVGQEKFERPSRRDGFPQDFGVHSIHGGKPPQSFPRAFCSIIARLPLARVLSARAQIRPAPVCIDHRRFGQRRRSGRAGGCADDSRTWGLCPHRHNGGDGTKYPRDPCLEGGPCGPDRRADLGRDGRFSRRGAEDRALAGGAGGKGGGSGLGRASKPAARDRPGHRLEQRDPISPGRRLAGFEERASSASRRW